MDYVGTASFMDWNTIEACANKGAEVLNHSCQHIFSEEESSKRSDNEIQNELIRSKTTMSEHGFSKTANIYVYPGASAGRTWKLVSKEMRVGINSSGSKVNKPPLNLTNLSRYPVGNKYTPSFEEMKGFVDDVIDSNGWEIWMIHSHYSYVNDVFISNFEKVIDYCFEKGVRIVSAYDALNYLGV